MNDRNDAAAHRVLLVDDHEISREFAAQVLKRAGTSVRQSKDIDQAVYLAIEWLPDRIITDWRLGRQTGADLVRAIRRAWPVGSPLPRFVLLTGEEGALFPDGNPPAAFDHVLYKPCSEAELTAALGLGGPCGVMEPTPPVAMQLHQSAEAELRERLPEMERLLLAGRVRRVAKLAHQVTASSGLCGAGESADDMLFR